jgi:DNA adenine methylase
VLNDANAELANFWEVLKRDFDALAEEVRISLHSRKLHKNASVVYANPDMFDRIKRAWAVWMLTNAGFGSMINGTWGSDAGGKRIKALRNKRAEFTAELSRRLRNTRIENCDAVKIIKFNDAPDALFYTDPPYVGADQGHYAGYTQADFDKLLAALSGIKGRFLLSSYPNDSLAEYVRKYGWHQIKVEMNNSMSASGLGHKVIKTEVLTANYPINKHGAGLFG